MTRKQTVFIIVVVAIAAVLGIIAGRMLGPDLRQAMNGEEDSAGFSHESATRPEKLPSVTLMDLEGNEVSSAQWLAEDKALFINFWATWCRPCREEMPLLSELQERYRDDVLMVGVAIDNKEAIVEFLDHLGGVSYPIVLGEQELDAIEAANKMGVDLVGLPITLTTDRNGRIIDIHMGEVDEAEAIALIENALHP